MKPKKFTLIHNEVGVTPLTQSINYGYPSKEMGELLGSNPISFFGLYQEEKVDLYADVDYWTKMGQAITDKAKKDLDFFKKILVDSEKLKKETLALIQRVGKPDKIELPNQELIELVKKISQNGFMMSALSQLGAVADHYHNIFSDSLEKTILEAKNFKKSGLNKSGALKILTTSPFVAPSEEARQKLIDIKLSEDNQGKEIKKYLDKWHWLFHGHAGPSLTEEDIIDELNSNLEIEDKGKIQKEQVELENKIFTKEEEKNLFAVARIFIYLKGMRAEICNGVFFILNLIAEKISRETGVEKKLLWYLSLPEMIEYLESSLLPPESELVARRRYSVWDITDHMHMKIYIGKEAEKFLEERACKKEQEYIETDIIKGSVAYPGKVQGKVRIINSINEINKIKEGDIMVSIQTMPEFLPAMKKAAAFVTNIGGITSHAAIVSREMKTPCIVGTKIATQILQDGDEVEVDAEHGIVKILKKNN